MGRTLGQGPQRPPDISLSLGLLLTPQLLQRKRKKGTTKVKMRRRQWSVGPSPDGLSWEHPSGLSLPTLIIRKPVHRADLAEL